MAEYMLIGKKLGHSFSKPIHESLKSYTYDLKEIPDEKALSKFLTQKKFKGLNVTIPYKQAVMPFCDVIDVRAEKIGAVNTIVKRRGKLYGYNTDYDGVLYMLDRANISLLDKNVLLLGSGATCRTVQTVALNEGAKAVYIASRHPQKGHISYQEALNKKDVDIIINVSPAGMYPNNDEYAIDLSRFPNLKGVADVVYNPLTTRLIYHARQLGIPATNGLSMLVAQAVAAARLFTNKPFLNTETERILNSIYKEKSNIVFVGMPSSGKSTLGTAIAEHLDRPFVDTDYIVEKMAGCSITSLFSKEGEAVFRRLETQALASASALSGRVIATGGGIVTQPQNLPLLKQNGIIIFLNRPVSHLKVSNHRPLSKDVNAILKMHGERLHLYEAVSDIEIKNSNYFLDSVDTILKAIKSIKAP